MCNKFPPPHLIPRMAYCSFLQPNWVEYIISNVRIIWVAVMEHINARWQKSMNSQYLSVTVMGVIILSSWQFSIRSPFLSLAVEYIPHNQFALTGNDFNPWTERRAGPEIMARQGNVCRLICWWQPSMRRIIKFVLTEFWEVLVSSFSKSFPTSLYNALLVTLS